MKNSWFKTLSKTFFMSTCYTRKVFQIFSSFWRNICGTIQIQPTSKIPCIDLTVQNAVLAIKWQLFRLSKNRLLFPEKVVSHIKANLDGCSSQCYQLYLFWYMTRLVLVKFFKVMHFLHHNARKSKTWPREFVIVRVSFS